jgi:CheY-like chemotaxis protein
VIEDQPAILEVLRDLVTLLGLDADCAADGATGLARLEGGQYDVVLTDLAMPGMNGWDVVRGIRARAPDLPIIVITGTAGDADRRRARAEGVPLVCKPFRIGALESIIQESLDRRAG